MTNRFNNLTDDSEITNFVGFSICPWRDDRSQGEINGHDGTEVVQCGAGEAQAWGIYGLLPSGEFMAVHDETEASEIVRIALQIAIKTARPVNICEEDHGSSIYAFEDFAPLAEAVTEWIHDDLPDTSAEDFRDDDFDNHPLAELREALVKYSDYAGLNTMADPYVAPLKEYAFDCKFFAVIRVSATDETEARKRLEKYASEMDCNGGAWENGDPILFNASMDGEADLYDIDGGHIL